MGTGRTKESEEPKPALRGQECARSKQWGVKEGKVVGNPGRVRTRL